jgi:hypothetical protein
MSAADCNWPAFLRASLRYAPGFIFRAFSKASAARANQSCLSGDCPLLSLPIDSPVPMLQISSRNFRQRLSGRRRYGEKNARIPRSIECRGQNDMLKVWGRRSSFNVQKVMWLVGELDLAHEHIDAGGCRKWNAGTARCSNVPRFASTS